MGATSVINKLTLDVLTPACLRRRLPPRPSAHHCRGSIGHICAGNKHPCPPLVTECEYCREGRGLWEQLRPTESWCFVILALIGVRCLVPRDAVANARSVPTYLSLAPATSSRAARPTPTSPSLIHSRGGSCTQHPILTHGLLEYPCVGQEDHRPIMHVEKSFKNVGRRKRRSGPMLQDQSGKLQGRMCLANSPR